MSPFLLPGLADLESAHGLLISRFGGAPGWRDRPALIACLGGIAQHPWDSPEAMAAALWARVGQSHPFRDGNKRVAFAAMMMGLRLNGRTLAMAIGWEDVWALVAPLYDRHAMRETTLAPWLAERTAPVADRP